MGVEEERNTETWREGHASVERECIAIPTTTFYLAKAVIIIMWM